MPLKRRLEERLEALLAPIRARRAELAADPAEALAVAARGSARTREVAATVLADVRAAFSLG